MSIPIIESSEIQREQSVTDIILSVALEQTALSHILNAEGEKLQAFIAMPDITAAQLLAVNRSVKSMVDAVSKLETHLHSKLNLFETVLQPISFSFLKLDTSTGRGLGGAVFALLDLEGEQIATATSRPDGRVTFFNVDKGNYTLTELQAPTGYYYGLGMFPVQVISRNNITIIGQPAADFRAYNTPYSDLTVLKVDDVGQPLAGGVFQLVGPDSTLTLTTGTDGTAVFPRLEPGTYELTETQPPSGFQGDTTPHTVEVQYGGGMLIDDVEATSLTVTNTPIATVADFE